MAAAPPLPPASEPATATAAGPLRRWRDQPWWPWARRALTLAFFGLVTWLLVSQARQIDWAAVWVSVQQRSAGTIVLAAALAACSHGLYSSFDLFGRRLSGHRLPVHRVMATTFVSYVYNLNLGTLIGGMAFRYRLYWQQGLATDTVTTVLVTSMLTNWIGYLALAGGLLLWQPPALPAAWGIADEVLPVAGGVMLLVVLGWLLACGWATRRRWVLRGKEIALPGGRMALLQVGASSFNWVLMSGVMFTLLGAAVPWPTVLGALLVAAVAGVMAHVPGGLGVIEAVFLALLAPGVPTDQVLAAVLLYRALYYLAPLLVAVPVHAWLERQGPPGDA